MRLDIQALRALSVLLVVGYHLWPGRLPGGFVGVDVFFVISGFLITEHLLRDTARNGRVSLLHFWTRRAFRLLPAALLVIVTTSLATVAFVTENEWQRFLREALAATFYVENWALSQSATEYLTASDPPTAFQHFWSLSVEEQFYIVLPLVLAAVVATAGAAAWKRRFGMVLGIITALSLAWSVYLTASNPAAAYFVTPTRAWEFGLGALLAFAGSARLLRVPPVVAWIGVAAIVVAGFGFSGSTPFPGYAALLPTVGAVLVLATVRHDQVFAAVAEWRPIQVIGDASYSIYLWHWPIIVIAPYVVGHSLGFLPRAVLLVASIGIGWLSMTYVERPFRARGLPRWRSRSGAAVSIGMTIALVLGAGGLMMVDRRVAAAQEAVDKALKSGDDPCVGAPALGARDCPAPTTLTPSLALLPKDDGNRAECWASTADSTARQCTLHEAKDPKVRALAVGDSHNNSLLPAYARAAEQLGWTLEAAGKGGCYLTTANVPMGKEDKGACAPWRKTMLDRIVADDDLDVVIVTRREIGLIDGPTEATRRERTEEGLQSAWSRIVKSGKKIVVVQDVPNAEADTISCVSEHGLDARTKCALPQERAFPNYSASREAAQGMSGVTYVPVEDLFCRDEECPPVIGGVPVFFNPGHLSETFAATLAPALADKLAAAT